MQPFSLIDCAWIPVRRRISGASFVRPSQIVEHLEDDPVVAIDWPRADFSIATLEWLIGLVAIADPPESARDWSRRWHVPPSADDLDKAFKPLAHAFILDGDGPRFMQDLEEVQAKPNGVASLLIEAPGEQTQKRNTDLLVKRGRVAQLGRAAAAIALYTLQTYAPAGGAGNRTGLRGGGPLTTLAIPPTQGPLSVWNVVWANTPIGKSVSPERLPHVLPWLTRTRVSDKSQIISPAETDDRLAFWGMPRRVRLDFEDAEGGLCDLTGVGDQRLVRSWRQRPYGANYQNFEHFLTPHYRSKPNDRVWLPVHPQPGGIGYRHFLGLVFHSSDQMQKPAGAIDVFRDQRLSDCVEDGPRSWRIFAAGYDMDNMKARNFVESEMPVMEPADPDRTELSIDAVTNLILGAREAEALLRRAVRNALFSAGADLKADAGLFSSLRARFWSETEPAFFTQLQRLSRDPDAEAAARVFLAAVLQVSMRIFEETAPILDDDRPDRIAAAARNLRASLNGYGKSGIALFAAFGLPAPEPAAARKGRTRKAPA